MRTGPFEYAFEVRLNDTDAAGVLFFAHLFRHAHEAYESLMTAAGFPLKDLIRRGTALPIVHAEADYKAPMHLGDQVRVEVSVGDVRQRSFSLDYRFLDARGLLLARAGTVHVLKGAGQSPPLPADLGRALARWKRVPEPEGRDSGRGGPDRES
jgi:1,4-dihydroxy-2-naphthoyl-CoA hydrolase